MPQFNHNHFDIFMSWKKPKSEEYAHKEASHHEEN